MQTFSDLALNPFLRLRLKPLMSNPGKTMQSNAVNTAGARATFAGVGMIGSSGIAGINTADADAARVGIMGAAGADVLVGMLSRI